MLKDFNKLITREKTRIKTFTIRKKFNPRVSKNLRNVLRVLVVRHFYEEFPMPWGVQ